MKNMSKLIDLEHETNSVIFEEMDINHNKSFTKLTETFQGRYLCTYRVTSLELLSVAEFRGE